MSIINLNKIIIKSIKANTDLLIAINKESIINIYLSIYVIQQNGK